MNQLEDEIVKFIAEKTGHTVEQVNDSEPFYLHQGEVTDLIAAFHKKKLEDAGTPFLTLEEFKAKYNKRLRNHSVYWIEVAYEAWLIAKGINP